MPYDINNYEPLYGGVINSAGNIVNTADLMDRFKVPLVAKYISIASLAATTAGTLWTPPSGKKLRVMGITVSSTIAGIYLFRDGGVAFHVAHLIANESQTFTFHNGILFSAANNSFDVYNSNASAGTVRVSFYGTEE